MNCPTDGDAKCVSCSGAFFLVGTTCSPHVVDCDGQGRVQVTAASNIADAVCGDPKQCTCASSGTAATGVDCPNDGDAKCATCTAGYGLSGTVCEECTERNAQYNDANDASPCGDHTGRGAGHGFAYSSTSGDACTPCNADEFSAVATTRP